MMSTFLIAHRLIANRSKVLGTILVGAFVLLLIVYGGAVTSLRQARQDALAAGEHRLQKIVAELADHTDSLFEAVRLHQTSIVGHVHGLGPDSPAALVRLLTSGDRNLILEKSTAHLPYVVGATFADAQGRLFGSTSSWPIQIDHLGSGPVFKDLQLGNRAVTALGGPKYNRLRNVWIVPMAHRISAPGGDFIGMLVFAVSLESLSQVFERSASSGLSIALYDSNGSRFLPYPRDGRSATGDRYEADAIDVFDTRIKVAITQPVHRYKLLVLATATSDSLLGGWWRHVALATILPVMATLLFAAGLLAVLAKRWSPHDLWRWGSLQALPRGEAIDAAKAKTLGDTLDSIPIGILVFDREQRLVFANRRYAEIYKFSPEQLAVGTTLAQIAAHHVAGGTFEVEVPDNVQDEATAADFERSARAPPAGDRRVELILAAAANWTRSIRKLSDGRVISVNRCSMPHGGRVSTHEDVTGLQDLRHEYNRSLELIASIIENVPVTLFVKEARSLRYLLVNRAGEKQFQLPRAQLIGKGDADILSKEQSERIATADREFLASGESRQVTERTRDMFRGDRLHRVTRLKVGGTGEARYILSIVEEMEQNVAQLRRTA